MSLDDTEIETFRFYPNPVSKQLNIEMPLTADQLEVSIFNQLGQEVLHQYMTEDSSFMNVSDLASGIYLIKLSTTNNSKTYKFIKSTN